MSAALLVFARQVAYTFDAGPNAVVYLLDDQLEATLAAMLHSFQPVDGQNSAYGCARACAQVCVRV